MKNCIKTVCFLFWTCVMFIACIDDDVEEGTVDLQTGENIPVFSVVTFFDSGSFGNPFVVGGHQFRQVVVGYNIFRNVMADSFNDTFNHEVGNFYKYKFYLKHRKNL